MEFSSDSDEDLREAMMCNFRTSSVRDRHVEVVSETEGINSSRCVLPNGVAVEVRKGCIFNRERKAYISVIDAKRCPHRFFGDPSKPIHSRKVRSEDLYLWYYISTRSTEGHWARVTLSDAVIHGAYVYDVSFSTRPSKNNKKKFSHGIYGCFKNPFILGLKHLYTYKSALLEKDETILEGIISSRTDTFAVDCPSNSIVMFHGDRSLLTRTCGTINRNTDSNYTNNDCCTHNLGISSQKALGVCPLYYNAEDVNSYGAIVLGTKDISFINYGEGSDNFTNCFGQLPRSFDIWCSVLDDSWRQSTYFPCAFLGSGRNIYFSFLQNCGEWLCTKMHRFKTTHVTSLYAFNNRGSHAHPQALLCGMRNGTIQILDLSKPLCTTFDTAVRHRDAGVSSITKISSRPYNFVTTSEGGSTRVWDIRFFAEKEPVYHLQNEDLHSQTLGARSSSCENFLVVSAHSKITIFDLHEMKEVVAASTSSLKGFLTLKRISSEFSIFQALSNGIDIYTFYP